MKTFLVRRSQRSGRTLHSFGDSVWIGPSKNPTDGWIDQLGAQKARRWPDEHLCNATTTMSRYFADGCNRTACCKTARIGDLILECGCGEWFATNFRSLVERWTMISRLFTLQRFSFARNFRGTEQRTALSTIYQLGFDSKIAALEVHVVKVSTITREHGATSLHFANIGTTNVGKQPSQEARTSERNHCLLSSKLQLLSFSLSNLIGRWPRKTI